MQDTGVVDSQDTDAEPFCACKIYCAYARCALVQIHLRQGMYLLADFDFVQLQFSQRRCQVLQNLCSMLGSTDIANAWITRALLSQSPLLKEEGVDRQQSR